MVVSQKGRNTHKNRGRISKIAAICVFFVSLTSIADAASRIKDIASFEGVRENMLVGYGLVVGLNGTGDSLGD